MDHKLWSITEEKTEINTSKREIRRIGIFPMSNSERRKVIVKEKSDGILSPRGPDAY